MKKLFIGLCLIILMVFSVIPVSAKPRHHHRHRALFNFGIHISSHGHRSRHRRHHHYRRHYTPKKHHHERIVIVDEHTHYHMTTQSPFCEEHRAYHTHHYNHSH